jgi:anti-anti-sigma factor
MQITAIKSGAITVAALDGRLDAVTSAKTEETLLGLLNDGSVVADLERVGYMSSAGLRLLLKAAKLAKSIGVSFSVCASQPAVREVFEMSGFDKIIPAFVTRDEAIAGA